MAADRRERDADAKEAHLVRVFDRLVPPELHADAERQLRARVLVAASLGLAGLALAALGVRVATAPFDRGAVVGFLTAGMVAALPWIQRWTRSHRVAGGVFVSICIVTFPLFHWLLGIFPAPALLFFPIVPLLGAFFVGVRFGLIAAAVMSAIAVALKLGLPPPSLGDLGVLSWTFAAICVAMCLMSALLAAAYEHARRRSSVALEEARARAEAASRSKTEFLRHMSHELRTPLTAILGYGELLQEELEEAGEARFAGDVAKIRGASTQLMSLISDLLDISRIEAGAVDLAFSEVSLVALLAEVRETAAPLAAANRDAIEVVVTDDLPGVVTDRHRLRQVLLNLVSNACKFTEDGRVVISASLAAHDPRAVILRVRDTGVGMTPEQRAQIFEPFVQVHASIERRRQGSGLGLTISRRLVEALGGAITVESEVGSGTEFTVRLPRVHPSAATRTRSGPLSFVSA